MLTNAQLKQIARLSRSAERRATGQFLLEGVRVLEDYPGELQVLLVDRARRDSPRVAALCERFGEQLELVDGSWLERMTPAETSQGVLGVALRPPAAEWRDVPALLYLEELQDPGNVGTLLRTARACGAGVVVRGGAELYGPKVVRASAGALFHVPILSDFEGFVPVALAPRSALSLFEARLPERPVFLLGNEGQGLSDEALGMATLRVSIPMAGGCESLNVAVAGSLVLYEWFRQRGGLTHFSA